MVKTWKDDYSENVKRYINELSSCRTLPGAMQECNRNKDKHIESTTFYTLIKFDSSENVNMSEIQRNDQQALGMKYEVNYNQ